MSAPSVAIRGAISNLYRTDWGRIVATLIRLVGDFDLAEEVAQEAFAAALERWTVDGVPEYPRAWLIQTGKNLAINRIRRKYVLGRKLEAYGAALEEASDEPPVPTEIPDDLLRLLFTCCHPSLALEAQVALTLRTLCGIETDEIARAFLVPPSTMAQRLVRAKSKIEAARIPYVVPETSEMPERVHAVLTVLYLVFTEGYAATRGASMLRTDLSAEAIRLARVLHSLLATSEVSGLLALMLLQDSRRETRVDEAGDVVLLEDQDRSRWDQVSIAEALPLVVEAMNDPGPFALQAAIAAVHARATDKNDTDWREILRLYDLLEEIYPTAVVTLNRAVAVAIVEGPEAALALVDALPLEEYHLLHAARADFKKRLGDRAGAEASYRRALELVGNDSERRFLERRLRELQSA